MTRYFLSDIGLDPSLNLAGSHNEPIIGTDFRCGTMPSLQRIPSMIEKRRYLVSDLLHTGNGGVTCQLVNVLKLQGGYPEMGAGFLNAPGDLLFQLGVDDVKQPGIREIFGES